MDSKFDRIIHHMEKLNYTWDEQFKDTGLVCEQLEKDEFQPDVIVGMYHDQVLTPLKTLYEYDAINIKS